MRSCDARATTAGLLFIAATATSLVTTAFLVRRPAPEGTRFIDTVPTGTDQPGLRRGRR